MKRTLTFLLIAAVGATTATAAIASGAVPAAAQGQAFWAETHWDDDDDDDHQPGTTRIQRASMPVPNAEALRQAGMVRVLEVERDDGRIEVEGFDAKGREIEIQMDAAGQRILRIERDSVQRH